MDDGILGQQFAGTASTRIAINVTTRHLADPGFARTIIDLSHALGLTGV